MSSSSMSVIQEEIEVVYEATVSELSTEDPPMEEWASRLFEIPEENKKRLLYADGLYDPGSGEICTKYIPLSDSAVYRHPYYNYPCVHDPGIKEALLLPEERIIYPVDGQDRYLALCEEMKICPIKSFHRGLLEDKINLRYYGINPIGIRAMALALLLNKTVRTLDLTDNWLNEDGCYHLGQMLIENVGIEELILSGCRIGPEGARKLFYGLPFNRTLTRLDVSKNKLGDVGMEHLAKAIFQGTDVKQINLSHNDITGTGAAAIAVALETHNHFTHFDISWNNLYTPGTYDLLVKLSENTSLRDINLSWNGLGRTTIGLRTLLKAPNIRILNLSNNRLSGDPIVGIGRMLLKIKRLHTLDLSQNPLTANEALVLLQRFLLKEVKVHNLYLDRISVTKEFLETLSEVKSLSFRKNFVITYGDIIRNYEIKIHDIRDIVIRRAEYLARKPKKNSIDICLVILQLIKDNESPMGIKHFMYHLKRMNCQIDADVIEEIGRLFPGVPTEKYRTIDLLAVAEYMKRKWPDRKLPPTPPPEPEPEPKKKGKHKGKKKK